MAWLSTKLKGQSFKLPYDFLAGLLPANARPKIMNKLLGLRERINLTQEELAEKSSISVRTIQRIEAGTIPKGHTLKALTKALSINENELLGKKSEINKLNYSLIKVINISSLPFVIVPLANIFMPLIIMFIKKQFNPITKQIISLQILWVVLSVIFFLIVSIVEKWFFSGNKLNLAFMMLAILTNIFIILRNTAEIDKNQKLYIKLNFSII